MVELGLSTRLRKRLSYYQIYCNAQPKTNLLHCHLRRFSKKVEGQEAGRLLASADAPREPERQLGTCIFSAMETVCQSVCLSDWLSSHTCSARCTGGCRLKPLTLAGQHLTYYGHRTRLAT